MLIRSRRYPSGQVRLWFLRALCLGIGLGLPEPATAQLVDLTQVHSSTAEGIHKSLEEQEGAGRGDRMLVDSSFYVIQRDPFRAIRRGRQLFQRKFGVEQGLGPRTGDGRGDLDMDLSVGAGLADSCAACHGRPRGAAGSGGDVVTRPDSRDAPHLFGLGLKEMLADEMTTDLRAIRDEAIATAAATHRRVRRSLLTKGVTFGSIVARPDGSVDTSAVEGVDVDLRVRPFFLHGGTISIREFVVGALRNEMGIEVADSDLLVASDGGRVVTPAGMILDGSKDRIEPPPLREAWEDRDGDGVAPEVSPAIVDYLEFYLLNYFKPALHAQDARTMAGFEVFQRIGCASCHVPDMPLRQDRRVADVETGFDPVRGVFNRLFAVATPLHAVLDDATGLPPLKPPLGQPFLVRNLFTDFKRHDLGPAFHERNYDGSVQTMFLTAALWGVGTTAPYGHDGRSINLHEAILRHGGEATESRDRFERLAGQPGDPQGALLAFLNSLVLFPPDDTASNLGPADPGAVGFPQAGHGSIRLSALFNDPFEAE